jgi:hypothetical protein
MSSERGQRPVNKGRKSVHLRGRSAASSIAIRLGSTERGFTGRRSSRFSSRSTAPVSGPLRSRSPLRRNKISFEVVVSKDDIRFLPFEQTISYNNPAG